MRDRAPSASGTKRNRVGAHGISGAEGKPAAPSTWQPQPPLTQTRRHARTASAFRLGVALAHQKGRSPWLSL
jgi:hypothetical protein